MMVAENFVSVGSGVATIAAAVLVSYQIILLKRQEMQEYFSDFNARYAKSLLACRYACS